MNLYHLFMWLERLSLWPKRRLLTAWWAIQAVLVFAAWFCTHVGMAVRFKRPPAADLSKGWHDALNAVVQIEFWGWYGGSMLLLAVLQGAILWPVRRPAPIWKPGQAGHGRSMWFAIVLAGLFAGVLWGGVVLAAVDASWLLTDHNWSDGDEAWRWIVIPPLLGWIAATPLLVRFLRRGRREDRLGRLASRLFLGTVIETVAIIPLDVMVRRKTDCYCGQGTFVALVACATVGFAALGPAVVLPILAHRRKRWYAKHCDACGYDMSGTMAAERCPECGVGWKETARPARPGHG